MVKTGSLEPNPRSSEYIAYFKALYLNQWMHSMDFLQFPPPRQLKIQSEKTF